MSAQAGILFFDGRPIDIVAIGELLSSVADYGEHDTVVVPRPGLVMIARERRQADDVHRSHRTSSPQTGNQITWDGRLDNRHELVVQLWRQLPIDRTDAAIALAAYERWGDAAFAMLDGDWSLVIWDESASTLVMSVDHMSIRGLYYSAQPEGLYWSTSLTGLVERLRCRDALDVRYIVGFITASFPADVSPYSRISPVPAGSVIHWGPHGHSWRSPHLERASHPIRHSARTDCERELIRLFAQSVESRMRTHARVSAQLSGGIDSSSVVCMADLLIKSGRAGAHELHTVSYVSDTSPEADERRFIDTVESWIGRRGDHLPAENMTHMFDAARDWVSPRYPHGVELGLLEAVRARGSRVLMTGQGGDDFLGNYLRCPDGIAADLLRWAVFQAVARARKWALSAKVPIATVLAEALGLLRRPEVQAKARMWRLVSVAGARDKDLRSAASTAFLLPTALADIWMDTVSRHVTALSNGDVSHWTLLEVLYRVRSSHMYQAAAEYPWVAYTHPFLDRALMAYVLSIPMEILYGPGEPRALMRRAFASFVPDRIISRRSKGNASPFFARHMRAAAHTWIDNPKALEVVRLGFVDPDKLTHALTRVVSGAPTTHVRALPAIVALEEWLQRRSLNARAGERTTTTKGGEYREVRTASSVAGRLRS